MILPKQLENLTAQIQKTVDDFNIHLNINTICDELRQCLVNLAEEIVAPLIEQTLNNPEILAALKISAGTQCLRFHGYRSTSIRLLTGQSITIRSPYFIKAKSKNRRGPKSSKRKPGAGRHFGLEYLGFIGRVTMLLGSAAVQAAVLCPSFELAGKMLGAHAIRLDEKTIRRICICFGDNAMPLRGNISLSQKDDVQGRMVIVRIDGGRIRERRPKRGRRPAGQKSQGYHTEWKEPKQFVIEIRNPDGEIVKDQTPLYDATLGDIDAAFDLLEIYLQNLNIASADTVVFCGDGNRIYWKRAGKLMQKLGVSNHHEIVDYTHAKQNLFEIISMLPKKLSAKNIKQIADTWKNLLWRGKLDELKRQIQSHIHSPHNCKKALSKLENYFIKNHLRMCYSKFSSLNLPIGSGCVESASVVLLTCD